MRFCSQRSKAYRFRIRVDYKTVLFSAKLAQRIVTPHTYPMACDTAVHEHIVLLESCNIDFLVSPWSPLKIYVAPDRGDLAACLEAQDKTPDGAAVSPTTFCRRFSS